MLFLEEVVQNNNNNEKNRILINPFLITTVRHTGIYTTIHMSDGQVIRVTDNIQSIKVRLDQYDLSVVHSKVTKKDTK